MSTAITILTVLVVEDDQLVRMHGIGVLEEAGFQVIEADNADVALEILDRGVPVTLLFSDIAMPGSMDGLELVRVVHERWPSVRLLLTSGHHRLMEGEAPEAVRFVRKPWNSESLVGHVRELVNS